MTFQLQCTLKLVLNFDLITCFYNCIVIIELSIPLQSMDMRFSLVVRWKTGFSTTWWCILKALNGGGMSDLRTLPSLSYLKPLPTLQLLCLQTSYRVQLDRRHSRLILGAGFNILCISCLRLLWPSCYYHIYVLLAYTCYVGGQVCCGSGEKGFTLYVHCLSSIETNSVMSYPNPLFISSPNPMFDHVFDLSQWDVRYETNLTIG